MEDVLTSNVFGFFKYADRSMYLKNFLQQKIELDINDKDAIDAEFNFWPTYLDGTEPDVVIIVGDYYILVEAKYFSDFGKEVNGKKAQLFREIEGGQLEAENLKKKFLLLAVTADYLYKPVKYKDLPPGTNFSWINWQAITDFIEVTVAGKALENCSFAVDLYDLLLKKNLRAFYGYSKVGIVNLKNVNDKIFFDYENASYRGAFIGFINALDKSSKIRTVTAKSIFFNKGPLWNQLKEMLAQSIISPSGSWESIFYIKGAQE
jgi:hypothetical protein